MRFYHTKCKGEIDVKKRQCTGCKKKWNPISFRFDPTGIRPIVDRKGKLLPDKYQKLVDKQKKYSLFNIAVSKLPKWPKWARIVTTVVVIAIVVLIIYLIRR